MALSVEKLLTDAHSLILRLKDDDSTADTMIASTRGLFLKVEAMKQYQDDITELNEIAKHRPRSTLVLGIAQENRQIRELQQENRELQATLEDHQSALELIMQKYREHTVKLLQSSRMEKALQEKEMEDKNSMCHLMDKIDEMAGVMQKAIEVDDSRGCADKERLSQLEVENRTLRELLEICTTSRDRIIPAAPPPPSVDNHEESKDATKEESPQDAKDEEGEDTANEEDDSSETDSSECNSTIVSAPSAPVKKEPEDSSEKKTGVVSSPVKKSPERGSGKESKDNSPTTGASAGKTAGKSPATATKNSGDVKKGKAGTPPVKRTGSNVSPAAAKKDSTAVRKSPSVENKKTDPKTKGAAAKSTTKK